MTDALTQAPTVARHVDARVDAVAAVLEDGWSYPSWVVGTARIRAVSSDWPSPGARLNHSVGAWPAMLSDETVCREYEPARRLVLIARGRPLGEAVAEITITRDDKAACRVSISEEVTTSGVQALIPGPLRHALIRLRNTETLHRLALLAERADSPTD